MQIKRVNASKPLEHTLVLWLFKKRVSTRAELNQGEAVVTTEGLDFRWMG